MKTYSKIIAGALAVMLSAGATGMYAMANKKEDEKSDSDESKTSSAEKSTQPNNADGKTFKEETVYVMTKANGSNDKIIVSDWLKNPKGLKDLEDVSNLKDIENTKTDEEFDASGNKLTWKTNGGDIYYKGNYSGDLPIEMKVTYTLDGKETKPEDMAGKSGKVTIRYDFTNKAKQTININGKDQQVYVPFLLTTGSILDGDIFSNVTIKNGKVISDGNKQIFVGVAMPGLEESLNVEGLKESLKKSDEKLDEKGVEIPKYVEISADVKNFEMPTTLTLATSNLLSNAQIDTKDILDAVESKLNEMSKGVDRLSTGAGKLNAGLNTLNGYIYYLLLIGMEYNISLKCGCRIIDMHYERLGSANGLKIPDDLLFTALCQHLKLYVIGKHLSLYDLTYEVIFYLAGCGKSYFDILKAQFYKIIEEFYLLDVLDALEFILELFLPVCYQVLECLYVLLWQGEYNLCLEWDGIAHITSVPGSKTSVEFGNGFTYETNHAFVGVGTTQVDVHA